QADSFGIIRGGHLDLCVLGGYEVAANGDLANWSTGKPGEAPAVGGAMDLGAGAKRVWVLMEHTTRDGRPKLVERCAYPLTALGSVTRIYTDLAVIDVTKQGFLLRDCAPGASHADVQVKTGATLHRQ
ncbi:3-oxoadipate CoA-transferase, partial [Acidiphilium sp. AL]